MIRILLKTLAFCIAIVLFYNCTSDLKKKINNITIVGKIRHSNKDSVFLREIRPNEIINIDSVKTDENGEFSFTFPCKEISYYVLHLKEKNKSITLICEPGEEVNVNSDIYSFGKNYYVLGSPNSKLVKELEDNTNKNMLLLDSMKFVYQLYSDSANIKEIKGKLDSTYMQIAKLNKEFHKKFIRKNSSSLASILALYKTFASNPILNPTEDFEYYLLIDSSLNASYPKSIHTWSFNKKIREIQERKAKGAIIDKKLSLGNKVSDVILNDIYGHPVLLSSLKGKFVLIDFWASWCVPCQKELPELKKIYNKYKSKGFEIYGISLDKHRQEWEYYVKREDLKWVNVSDLTYWNSPVVEQFNIEGIPFKILIDTSQVIITKNISITDLDVKLEEILK
ncbi:MAG: hypothetical protein A2X12_09985 [Bacteroidetes bacterium GWE2_29_8]|nr:MAG: hypothetical protein A2X12_09985 [Bacteroidetes bacterium GWE2_29_8]OFY20031.1 MAG: hypothetical protein A2X02_06610 [Bacteroidetes bacterium GWF2_29_10]